MTVLDTKRWLYVNDASFYKNKYGWIATLHVAVSFQLIMYANIEINKMYYLYFFIILTSKNTLVQWNEFALKQQKKHKLGVKNFLQKFTSRDGPVKSTETKQGYKHKKTTLLQKNCGKERPEGYSTSVAWEKSC